MPDLAPSLNLACAANAAYALPLTVMLRSVDAHLDRSRALEVFAIDDGLSAQDRERVERSLSARVHVHWLRPDWLDRARLPTWGKMPPTTYQKIALGDLLPAEVERVLWLDCDLLVTVDLGRLWKEELGENLLLAVRDRRVPTVSSRFGVAAHEELGLAAGDDYFNAGVMLLDIAGWRAAEIGERAQAYLERHGRRVVFWDQEALNAVLAGRWRRLDGRWNADPTLDALLAEHAADTASGLASDRWILHFTGRLKPWIYGPMSPSHALFFHYLDQTAWAGWRPSRSLVRALLARYANSSLRRRFYALEAPALALWRVLTRRTQTVG